MADEGKTPQVAAKAPQTKVDLNSLTFELRVPGNVVMDMLNSLKMCADKFKSSYDFLNKSVIDWVKQHMSTTGETKETTDNVENIETETKED